MARPRGPHYEKNLEKRKRQMIKGRVPKIPLCFSCGVPMRDHRIPIGDNSRVICDFCDDIMTKRGFLQISDNKRLYPDGTIKDEHFVVRDVVFRRRN